LHQQEKQERTTLKSRFYESTIFTTTVPLEALYIKQVPLVAYFSLVFCWFHFLSLHQFREKFGPLGSFRFYYTTRLCGRFLLFPSGKLTSYAMATRRSFFSEWIRCWISPNLLIQHWLIICVYYSSHSVYTVDILNFIRKAWETVKVYHHLTDQNVSHHQASQEFLYENMPNIGSSLSPLASCWGFHLSWSWDWLRT
jgi:hypothetical protein